MQPGTQVLLPDVPKTQNQGLFRRIHHEKGLGDKHDGDDDQDHRDD
jgi:hypothetical protein